MSPEDKILELRVKIDEFKLIRPHLRAGFPEDIKKDIGDLYASGISFARLHSELGVSYDSIRSWSGKPYAKSNFKELKINKVTAVDKREVINMSIFKNDVQVQLENLLITQVTKILEAL